MRYFTILLIAVTFSQTNGAVYQCNTNSPCGCSNPYTVLTRIVGGEVAAQGSWKWAVSLRYYGSHFCGGSILSSNFIITAAHCVNDIYDKSPLTILAGSNTLRPSSNTPYQVRSVSGIYKHPYYNDNSQVNDIALIKLSSPLDLTRGNLTPICVPYGNSPQPVDNIDLIAVGWGVTSMSGSGISTQLRQVTVKSMSSENSDCKSAIADSQVHFCAGLPEGGKDTCQGDSGGPIMAFVNGLWVLQGLTSYGIGCALRGNPGVYTRVSYYMPWIKSIVRQYNNKHTKNDDSDSNVKPKDKIKVSRQKQRKAPKGKDYKHDLVKNQIEKIKFNITTNATETGFPTE